MEYTKPGPPQCNDPLLLPFLDSERNGSQNALAELFAEYADPICSKIVDFRTRNIFSITYLEKEKLREDLKQEVRLKILAQLRSLQQHPSTEPIYDFRNYVARITHNLVHDYFRTEFRPAASVNTRDFQLPAGELDHHEWVAKNTFFPHKDLLPDFAADIEDEEERVFRLKRVWIELKQCPAEQCASWLLKIADKNDESTLKWLPVFQIATIREIAEVMGQDVEALANIWSELPLPDRRIAGMLAATERQVINWRKSANERLQRRMKKFLFPNER